MTKGFFLCSESVIHAERNSWLSAPKKSDKDAQDDKGQKEKPGASAGNDNGEKKAT
jgi:hypothetical protein